MKKINWSNFDYNDFERFCNILMSFEFGKKYIPYSAPGPDGGIDGQYEGIYGFQSGKWRFQFKFYTVARSIGVSTLKSRLKAEIKLIADENNYLLVTNVELLPQERVDLQNIVKNELPLDTTSIQFDIWDGAKLDSLAAKYPILQFWLNFGFKASELREYQQEYEKNLKFSNSGPDTLSNLFIGREDHLDTLKKFLYSEDEMAIIYGEAGIGKTRLAIQFFQKTVDPLDNWTALVFTAKKIDYDRLCKALFGDRKYIILVDDAHNLDPLTISELLSIAKQLSNVKFLLTSRKIEMHSTLALIKETEKQRIRKIEIGELSRGETVYFFQEYTKSSTLAKYANELASISFGKPILMVAIILAISEGTPIQDIKNLDFFNSYVKNYFRTFCDKVGKDIGIPILDVQKLVSIIALIEPFSFNSSEMIEILSSYSRIKGENIEYILKQLKENSYVNGRYEQSIKPDYYSDILVSELDPKEAASLIFKMTQLSSNIIVNLVSAQESSDGQIDVLRDALKAFIDLISTADNEKVVQVVLLTILRITQFRPESARYAIKVYCDSLSIEGHPSHKELEDHLKYNYHSVESIMGTAVDILKGLYDLPEHQEFVVRYAYILHKKTQDKRLVDIFSFNRRDIFENFRMERQNAFLDDLSNRLVKLSDTELQFSVNVLRKFSKLDFHVSNMDASNLNQINITNYFLTEKNADVVKFRSRMIHLLIDIYHAEHVTSKVRNELLKMLIDIPRSIFATVHNKVQYKNDEEIRIVLNFILSKSATFDLSEQKDVLEKLHWYQQWGISTDLLPTIEQIKTALQPKSLLERLSYVFSNAERQINRTSIINDYIRQKSREIITSEQPHKLSDAIIEYLQSQQYPATFFWEFVRVLELESLEVSKILYEKLYPHYLEKFSILAAKILSSIYFIHHDTVFYWKKVKELRALNTVFADNILLEVYGYCAPQYTKFNSRDIDVIIEIYKKGAPESEYSLSTAIQLLFSAGHEDALRYSKDFLDNVTQQSNVRMFFIRLQDNNSIITEQLNELVLNHTIRFELSYEIERLLPKVLASSSSEEILQYFFNRFEKKVNVIKETKTLGSYEFVPIHGRSRLVEELDEIKSMELFAKALDWYIDKVDQMMRYFAKDLLEYLQPTLYINDALYIFYSDLIRSKDQPIDLIAVYSSLAIFTDKTETHLKLISENFDKINDLQYHDDQNYKNLLSEAYMAIVSSGVKSGTPGEPFPQDLALKELLTNQIASLSDIDPAKKFFNNVLKSVQSDIDRDQEIDNTTW